MARKRAASPPANTAEHLDRKVAAEAYKKVMQGEPLTVRERTALNRYEKQREEKLRWEYYESIPQKHWRQMSGRATKVLNEQAERYGIPFGGKSISLPAVVRALHDFLAANSRRLASDDQELMDGKVSSPALERYREERAILAKLERMQRQQLLVSRDEVREGLGRMAAILRGAGESLQKQFGPAALDVLHEALDDVEREVRRMFGAADANGQQHGD